jgi:hypothetical protein
MWTERLEYAHSIRKKRRRGALEGTVLVTIQFTVKFGLERHDNIPKILRRHLDLKLFANESQASNFQTREVRDDDFKYLNWYLIRRPNEGGILVTPIAGI